MSELTYSNEEKIKLKPDSFSIVAGVSVGALNGSLIAAQKYEALKEIWLEELEEKGRTIIFTSKYISLDGGLELYSILKEFKSVVSFGKAVGHFFGKIFGKKKTKLEQQLVSKLNDFKSLADNKQLLSKLKSLIKKSDFTNTIFRCGLVSLVDGSYYFCGPDDFNSDEEFVKSVFASATMPIVWEPIDSISISKDGKEEKIKHVVDGGLRNVTPIGEVIDLINSSDNNDEYHLIVIANGDGSIQPFDKDPTLINVAIRSLLDITLDEIFDNDLKFFETINHMVSQSKKANITLKNQNGKVLKEFSCTIIKPKGSELGNSLDAQYATVVNRHEIGKKRAAEAFGNALPPLDS